MPVGRRSSSIAAERQLPAHLGLPVEGRSLAAERRLVQRAAGAGPEPGAVEEDAGAVDEAGDALALGC